MKKTIKIIIMILIIGVVVLGYAFYNLKSNSVYYAKNMPKGEGQHPELVMLIDNLDWIYTPDIDGLKYKIDGTMDIVSETESKGFGNIYSDETEYIYDEGDISYTFNRKFQLIHIMNVRKMETFDVNSVDKNKLIENIKLFVEPVIKQQKKPFINLQWLFNIIHQDEFK